MYFKCFIRWRQDPTQLYIIRLILSARTRLWHYPNSTLFGYIEIDFREYSTVFVRGSTRPVPDSKSPFVMNIPICARTSFPAPLNILPHQYPPLLQIRVPSPFPDPPRSRGYSGPFIIDFPLAAVRCQSEPSVPISVSRPFSSSKGMA